MPKNYLIGVDIGTQGTKAVVVTVDGEVLGVGFEEYEVEQPRPSWAEQWPQVWEEAVYHAVHGAVARAGVSPAKIAALCISGLYGGSGVPVDRDLKPLRPCLIWMDRRATDEVRWVKENLDLDKLFAVTGNYVDTYFGYTKILWIKNHEPEVWKRVWKFVPPSSYVELRLTGELAADFSSAGNLGGVFDIHRLSWSEEMAEALGIPLDLMPERLVPSTEVIGELTSEAAKRCGLVAGIPVVAGGIDAPMATLSAGAVEPGDNVAMMGTSTCWGVVHRGEGLSPDLVSMPHVVNPKEEIYTWGGSATSGALIRWFRDRFGQAEVEAAIKVDLDPYQILDLKAADIPPGSEGLLVLPYFMGERAPLWDPKARGTLVGLTVGLSQEVEPGTVVARLDDAAVRAGLEVAQAELKRLQAELHIQGLERQHQPHGRTVGVGDNEAFPAAVFLLLLTEYLAEENREYHTPLSNLATGFTTIL